MKFESLYEQRDRYPFLAELQEPVELIQGVVGKPYTHFFTELPSIEDRFLDFKETRLDPIRQFMSGPNKTIYDEASRFVQQQQPNFTALQSDKPERLQAILADQECYSGNQMRDAKALTDQLQAELQNASRPNGRRPFNP